MRSLWKLLQTRPGFRWLWLGETTSLVGDWLSYVAVSLLALEAGEGALGLALVFAAHILPTALVSPFAGVLADRVDKRRVLVGTQIAMAALMVLMVAAALHRSLIAVQAILFLRTTVAGFFYPAKQAALRELVEEDELVDANAIDAATWSVTFTVGTALGGVIAMAGPVLALAVDGVTFVVAGLLLARLPALPSEARDHVRPKLKEIVVALEDARTRPGLLEAVLTKAPLAVAGGGAWVVLNLAAERVGVLGSAALALGALQALRGVGTGIGPLLSKGLMKTGTSAQHLLRASAWVSFASMAAFIVAASAELGWLVLAIAALAWGMGSGGYWVFSAVEMQKKSPKAMLGRLASVDMLTFTVGQGLAALLGGYLADATGIAALSGWLPLSLGVLLYLVLRATLAPRRRVPTPVVTAPPL